MKNQLKTININRILAAVLTFAALLVGQSVYAADNWKLEASTSGSTTTFTISRTNTAIAETVRYRFVNLSAYAGQHYKVIRVNGTEIVASQQSEALSGEFTFTAGDTQSRTVTVTEMTPTTNAYKYQTTGTERSYKLEVTDAAGFFLAEKVRSYTTGTSVTSSGVFDIKDVTIQTSEYTADDRGYSENGYKSVASSSYCTSGTQSYLGFLNAQLRMTLSFDAKENDDAYEYLQLLVDNIENCDNRSGANNSDPGTPSLSRYMAGFEMDKDSKDATYRNYTFPVTSVVSDAGSTNPWGYGNDWPLHKQRFKSNCRATDGRIIIPTNFSTLVLRLNASGSSGSDEWAVKNVKAHIQAVDGTAPTKLAVSLAPGYHAKGNTIYVSVAFNEIVIVTDTPTLSTTSNNHWGSLSYVDGSGTNVLTFSTTIPANATGSLNITGLSGTVEDLAGNSLTGSGVTASNLCTLDPIIYTVRFDKNHDSATGTMSDMSFTYNVANNLTTNTFTRESHVFIGWNTQADGSGTSYADGQSVSNLTAENGGIVTLYAQWWVSSGTCGRDANWSYDLATHTLSITGTGEVTAWSENRPWQHLKGDMTTLNIADGITSIASSAFLSCNKLLTVTGGNGLTYVNESAFSDTPWYLSILSDEGLTYLGHVAYCFGYPIKCEVIIAEDTYTIANGASINNDKITAVTIPASVTKIGDYAFRECSSLSTVNLLGATPPELGDSAFFLSSEDRYKARTFYVRNAAYKTTDGWKEIHNKDGDYIDHDNFTMTVISTLSLPDGVSTDATPVTIAGTDYYTEGTTITISPTAIGYVLTGVTVNGTAATNNGDGTWSFTMPAADATVSATPINVWGVSADIDGSTAEKAYTISDTTGLNLLAALVNSGNEFDGKFFCLGDDIQYNYTSAWDDSTSTENNYTAIGGCYDGSYKYFRGTFDGQGHTVSGIRIYKGGNDDITDSYQGLFGFTRCATIKNVILADARITGKHNVGGIVGHSINSQIVENCRVGSDVTIHAVASNADYHGGVMGSCTDGTILGCVSAATLTVAAGLTEIDHYGGIVGSTTANMYDCLAIGASVPAVTSNGSIAGEVREKSTYTNNYYRNCTVGDANQTNANTLSAGTDVTLAPAGDAAQTYPYNGIQRYGDAPDGNALYYGGVLYVPTTNAGDNFSLSLGYSGSVPSGITLGYTANAGTLSGTGNPYTFTMPAEDVTINAVLSVNYIAADGSEKTCTGFTLIESGNNTVFGTPGEEHWYVVSGNVNIDANEPLKFYGAARLILCDGSTLTHTLIPEGSGSPIIVYGNLVIYGQSQGTGSLLAESSATAICVEEDGFALAANGTLTINGGRITAHSIDEFGICVYSSVTINGGTVSAIGSNAHYGIYTYGNITLGWTNVTDCIYASSYSASGIISIKDGQTMTDGSAAYSATVNNSDIANKMLKPCVVTQYVDASGTLHDNVFAIPLDNTMTTLAEGTYVVNSDVAYTSTLTTTGDVTLILGDGCTMSFGAENNGLDAKIMDCGGNLTIYGQAQGTGCLKAYGDGGYGIYVRDDYDYTQHSGNVFISIENGSCIETSSGTFTLLGGTLDVFSGSGNGDIEAFGGAISIQGGKLWARYKGLHSGKYDITLGYTNPTDLIYAKQYYPSVTIADGKTLFDGSVTYSSSVSVSSSDIKGKTLSPDLWGVAGGNDGSTAAKAYTITTTAGLDLLATLVNSGIKYNGKYFQLGNDITYSHTTNWNDATSTENNFTAIGGCINYYDKYFCGTFDGQGHTISGIRIYKGGTDEADCYQGLFGYTEGATIKNVILADARITGKQYVGGIAGYIIKDNGNGGIVENCRVGSDVTIHAVADNAKYHGGVVGSCNGGSISGTISGCVSGATLTAADGLTGISSYGGIVGRLKGKMSDCLALNATVPAVSKNGAIAGDVDPNVSYTNANNYHRDCTVGGNPAPSDIYNVGAYTVSAGTDVTVVPAGNADATYTTSGIQRYGNALYYDGVFYALTNASVSLTLGYFGTPSESFSGYTAGAGNLSGSANPYTLTMPARDVTVNVKGYVVPDLTVSDVTATTALATWTTCNNVSSYTLQLASDDQFTTIGTTTTLIDESFEDGIPDGWTASGNVSIKETDNTADGKKNCVAFSGSGAYLITPLVENPSNLSFYYVKKSTGSATGTPWSLDVSYSTSTYGPWTNIETIEVNDAVTVWVRESIDLNIAGSVYIKFTDTRSSGTAERYIDVIQITGTTAGNVGTGSLLNEYSVTDGTSYTFTGLTPETFYYTRVKGDDVWSNVIMFKTGINYTGVTFESFEGIMNAKFDGTSTVTVSIPTPITVDSVTYNRKFNANTASTVMLPFDYTCTSNGAEGGKFYRFVDVVYDNDNSIWVATMQETGNGVSTLTANTPYLFMPDGTKLTFSIPSGGVTLQPTTDVVYSTAGVSGSHWTFIGTYAARYWYDGTDGHNAAQNADEIGKVYGFAGAQKTGIDIGDFVRVANGAKIRPMSAYLMWSNTANQAPMRGTTRGAADVQELPSRITVRLVGASGDIDAVGQINLDNGQITFDGWYTLQGVKLDAEPTEPGIYINNGKKVMISK